MSTKKPLAAKDFVDFSEGELNRMVKAKEITADFRKEVLALVAKNAADLEAAKTSGKPQGEVKVKLTVEGVMAQLKADEITMEEATRLINGLQRPANGTLYCKVSEKGALSVYGLQRMPVTLYVQQWERLAAFMDDLTAFATDPVNVEKLSRKEEKK